MSETLTNSIKVQAEQDVPAISDQHQEDNSNKCSGSLEEASEATVSLANDSSEPSGLHETNETPCASVNADTTVTVIPSDTQISGQVQNRHQGLASSSMDGTNQPATTTPTWRDDLSNVLHEFQPLVRHAQRVNSFTSWLPNGPRLSGNLENGTIFIQPSTPLADSFIINVEQPTLNGTVPPTNNIPGHEPATTQSTGSNSNDTDAAGNVPPQNYQHQHSHNGADNTFSETLAQFPESRVMLDTLNRYTPYVFILLVKACYDHLDGILNFFALFAVFSHANWVVRQEISKQHQKKILPLLRVLLYIVLVIAIIGFMLEKKNIFISLMFAQSFPDPFTLKNLLFSVAITDLILKLITVAVKIIVTLLPPSMVEYKGRGRAYLMIEAISQLYRALAPIQPWLIYLLDSYTGSEKVMGVLLMGTYMVAKGSDLLHRAQFVKAAFIKFLQTVSFGQTPTKDQIQTAGGQCPICHDNFNTPVMLTCNHIFCDMCVGTWFDREQTCPLCRAKVIDDPAWRDGATTFFIQFY